MENKISEYQSDLINKSKNYLIKRTKNELILSPFCCLNSWSPKHLGYKRLKFINNGIFSLFSFVYSVIRSIIILGFVEDYKIFRNKNNTSLDIYEAVVFSWCKYQDFLNDGSFNDRYNKVNSRETKKIIFFSTLNR